MPAGQAGGGADQESGGDDGLEASPVEDKVENALLGVASQLCPTASGGQKTGELFCDNDNDTSDTIDNVSDGSAPSYQGWVGGIPAQATQRGQEAGEADGVGGLGGGLGGKGG